MKEQLFPSDTLSISDLRTILPSLLPTDRPLLVASDFDETLCNTYIYDPVTQNHIPQLNPDLVSLVTEKKIPLIIVTGRTASEAGMQQSIIPFIESVGGMIVCENGGVIINAQGEEIVVATPEEQEDLQQMKAILSTFDLQMHFPDLEVHIRTSRKSLIEVRIQDEKGKGDPAPHALAEQILNTLIQPLGLSLQAVSSNYSVSIQPKSISKARGLHAALKQYGIDRDDIFVIAMGDGPNDKELLQDADIGIAVGTPAKDFANVLVQGGENTALAVFECL